MQQRALCRALTLPAVAQIEIWAWLCKPPPYMFQKNKLLTCVIFNPWLFTTKDPPHPFTHQEEKHSSVSILLPLRKIRERKYIRRRSIIYQSPNTELLHLHYSPETQSHSVISLLTDSYGLWVASICASLNVIHFFPARISSFTLPCPQRTNQKSSRHFTRPAWHHKHPPHGKFTAVAHSQFTPNWQISLLGRSFTIAWHPVWQAELLHIPSDMQTLKKMTIFSLRVTGEVQNL